MVTLSTRSRTMWLMRVALVSSLLGVVALGGVASAAKSPHTKKPSTAKTTKAKATTQKVVAVTTISGYGEVLTTSSGMALYTYALDKKNHSACTGSCLSAWPALTVGAKVRPIGTTGLGKFRRSGTVFQVTYHGRPLYTFSSDTTAGTVNGNGVANFHVVVVKAAGKKSTTTTTSPTSGY